MRLLMIRPVVPTPVLRLSSFVSDQMFNAEIPKTYQMTNMRMEKMWKLRRPRRERRVPARFDDEDEIVQQLCGPPRPIKCTLCGQSLPGQHFIADGILYDACIECRTTNPSSCIPFTEEVGGAATVPNADDLESFVDEPGASFSIFKVLRHMHGILCMLCWSLCGRHSLSLLQAAQV